MMFSCEPGRRADWEFGVGGGLAEPVYVLKPFKAIHESLK